MRLSRDSYRHPPEAGQITQDLSDKIVAIAHLRCRFGYRRIHDRREEVPMYAVTCRLATGGAALEFLAEKGVSTGRLKRLMTAVLTICAALKCGW